ncbi:MAG: dihydroorotate dehydrogenase, partial [Patescibacteria group bacterium]
GKFMLLATTVAGIQLQHPVMNAAGPRCKTLEEIEELAGSLTAAIMVGSITLQRRDGNEGEVYYSNPLREFSLNSLGLPNRGALYYEEVLPRMQEIAHEAGKRLVVSVAAIASVEEYAHLISLALKSGADAGELNFGCPNVWKGGAQKRIVCFDPSMVDEILTQIEQVVNIDFPPPIFIKVSPFSDPVLLGEVASVIAKSPIVTAVTAINTFPNAFAYKEKGKSAISPQFSKGLAGMAGGSAFKAIGLGQVMQWRALLPAHIDVIGAGGVRTGQDVLDYRQAGADAVQVGTAYADEGVTVFDRILTEYASLVETEAVPI